MNWLVITIVAAGLAACYKKKVPLLGWLAASWLAFFVVLNWGINPPLPSSIIGMFMAIVSIALAVYASSDNEKLDSVINPTISFLVEKKYQLSLIIVVVALPLAASIRVYQKMNMPVQPPVFGRTIHPAPPQKMKFKGKKINLLTVRNPYRKLESEKGGEFKNHVKNGRRVYYENCVFCHGDTMKGDGLYSQALNPLPANFADPTTIAMLEEGFLFWRIAKGGPGLPEEAGPWSSAMPTWENFLSEEEIWDVILFLYDFTGQKPRAKEHVE